MIDRRPAPGFPEVEELDFRPGRTKFSDICCARCQKPFYLSVVMLVTLPQLISKTLDLRRPWGLLFGLWCSS